MVMIAGFYAFFAVAVILATRAEILERESRTRWVTALLQK